MSIYNLDVFLSLLEPVCCSMSGSNCCFLTCIQISQEAVKVVYYWIYSLFFFNWNPCIFITLSSPVHIMSKILWNKSNFISENFLAVQWLRLCFFIAGGSGSILGCKTKIPKAMRHIQKIFLFILTVFNSDYMLIIESNCFFLLQFLAHSSEGYHIMHKPI